MSISSIFIFYFIIFYYFFSDLCLGGLLAISGLTISSIFNIFFLIGCDGLSFVMVGLTVFLFPICFLISWETIAYKRSLFYLLLLMLELLLIYVFLVLDLFIFYSIFEFILLPLFLMIGIYGKRAQKIGAAYKLFYYTLLGSSFMFISLVYLLVLGGDLNYFTLSNILDSLTINIRYYIWFSFFLAFLVKLPVMPFHLWLPEAHVEAPTTGSVLLAGVLLKMGGYGIFRFILPLFSQITLYFIPLILTLGIISVIYASIVTVRQVDIKKIIAYSSVAHMGISLLGVFSGSLQGVQGSYFLMLSHGIISSGLFAGVGVIYDRYHTRLLNYYGGLVNFMPILATLFFLLILGNVSFPFTSSFIAEFLIFVGIFQVNTFITLLALVSTLFGVIYSFWVYVRIFFGPVSEFIVSFSDVNDREFGYLFILVLMMLMLGICPNFVLQILYFPILLLL